MRDSDWIQWRGRNHGRDAAGAFVVVDKNRVGKSVFLMNVGAHVAMAGKSVLWIALEI